MGCGIPAAGDGSAAVCAGGSGCSSTPVSAGGCGAVPSRAALPELRLWCWRFCTALLRPAAALSSVPLCCRAPRGAAIELLSPWSVARCVTPQVGGRVPVLDTLVELVTRGRSIPVHLDYLPRLESLVAEVQAWKECAANTFLCENSPYSLLEVRGLRSAQHRCSDRSKGASQLGIHSSNSGRCYLLGWYS